MKRKIIQTVFFVVSIALLYFIIRGGLAKDVHEFCPYSMVCIGTSTLFKIVFPAMLLGILIPISSIFWGRWFCSWVCFLGTAQESLFKTRKKFIKTKDPVPTKLDKYLSYTKYFVLWVTVCLSIYGTMWFMNFCPQNIITSYNTIGYGFVAFISLIFIASIFIQRVWCQYFCPFGALQLLAIKVGLSFKKMKKNRGNK